MVSNIWVAASDNQVKIVQDYITSGAYTANSKDPNGYTPIHAAASYGHIGLLEKLISSGGDINIQDNDGDTPLHHCEDAKTARFIIEKLDGKWDIKNDEGLTALESKEEDADVPELIKYLQDVKYGGSSEQPEQPQAPEQLPQEGILGSLPVPGDSDHNIRYSMETEEQSEISEQKRRQIEAIINGDNAEEELRKLVTTAVQEGMAEYRDQSSNKRRKD